MLISTSKYPNTLLSDCVGVMLTTSLIKASSPRTNSPRLSVNQSGVIILSCYSYCVILDAHIQAALCANLCDFVGVLDALHCDSATRHAYGLALSV